MPALEERIQRLEDLEAIRHLQARYCDCVDIGWKAELPDKKQRLLEEVFSDDIVFIVLTADGEATEMRGRQQVGDHYDEGIAVFKFGIHYVMNPRLEIAGDTATGSWPVLVPLTDPDGNPKWFSGKYFVEYKKTEDGWRISLLSQQIAFYTPFDEAWEPGVVK